MLRLCLYSRCLHPTLKWFGQGITGLCDPPPSFLNCDPCSPTVACNTLTTYLNVQASFCVILIISINREKSWLYIWRFCFPGGASGKEPACQCKRHRFYPWVGKIPWRKERQPTPVFLPGESHGQRSLVGYSPWVHRVGHDWVTNIHTHEFWNCIQNQLKKEMNFVLLEKRSTKFSIKCQIVIILNFPTKWQLLTFLFL